MANESLFGAAVRSDNSPTLAYSGYNHPVPSGSDLTSNHYAGALPIATDFGQDNFRVPWSSFNNDDSGNTRMYNLTTAQQISTMYGTAAPTLVFYSGNANGLERFTNNYQNDESYRIAKAGNNQTWHLRCIVRNGNENTNEPPHNIGLFVFGLNSAEEYDFSGYNIHTVTADNFDSELDIAITSSALPSEFLQENYAVDSGATINLADGRRIGGQINFGSQDNPISVSNTSTYAFAVKNYLSPGSTFFIGGFPLTVLSNWWDINAYFTIRNSSVSALSVRVDFDNPDNNKSFTIDKWSLRPMNISMSDIHSGTNISLRNDVYQSINTTAP